MEESEIIELKEIKYGKRRGQNQKKIKIENIYKLWENNGIIYMIIEKISNIIHISIIGIIISVICFYNFNFFNKSEKIIIKTWWRLVIFIINGIMVGIMNIKYCISIIKIIKKYKTTMEFCNKKENQKIFYINEWDDDINNKKGICYKLNTEKGKKIRNEIDIFNGEIEISEKEIKNKILQKLSFRDDVISIILRKIFKEIEKNNIIIKYIQKVCQTKYFIKYLNNVLNKTTKEIFLTTPINTITPNKFSYEHYLYLKEYKEIRFIFIETFKRKLIINFNNKIFISFIGNIFKIISNIIEFILQDFSIILNNTWSYGGIKFLHQIEFNHTQKYHLNKALKHAKNIIDRKKNIKLKKIIVKIIKFILIGSLIIMLIFNLNEHGIENFDIDTSSGLLSFLIPFKNFITTGIILFFIVLVTQYSNEPDFTTSFIEEKIKLENLLNYNFPSTGKNGINNLNDFYLPSCYELCLNELFAPFTTINLLRKQENRDLFANGLNEIWYDDRFVKDDSPYNNSYFELTQFL
ncbi:hypothetical protein EDI_186680 [Entamoeba dispar SAW760]|uniref:Uncharacterized protein n=1 Tax=Entamoeba dispar (strain ATCC PRA-260 / SAW760) TaxID=370354 RepID=B0EBA8_ENTDS|nr:uncharacterized protein EDI_186680 [Entamoeba dispar SAW760]EDR28197.1 hypothetical protein EDI_186680 [Entamoeba dispar SAW760]|eukprot:EDR28197.1 hypothetical protein EDI_186680 [Entamoeba dispar SAW760]